MAFETRQPEGREVETSTIKIFSRVAALTAVGAAWRVRMILRGRLSPGQKVVDMGTGPATIPLWLKRFFPTVSFTGLDVSLDMLTEAAGHNRRTGNAIALVAGDGTRLPFASGSLDGMISFFALHHLDEPLLFLKEADRVLKPGGIFLLIDFRRDMAGWLFGLINALWQSLFFFSHGRRGFFESVASAWRPDEIRAMLDSAGISRFTITSSKTELIIT